MSGGTSNCGLVVSLERWKRRNQRRWATRRVPLAEFLREHFDYVVTVCDRASEACPVFPGAPERIHWSFNDPAAIVGSDTAKQRAFDAVATELVARIRLWLSLPAVSGRLQANPTRSG